VRTVHGQNYVWNEPVVALGTLRQTRGNEYTGSFVLPDSIVFAALAVEDTAAREVDDFGGRTWEVLRASDTGEPTLASLEQRTNDMMGRSWEQGMLGVRRMLTLYPDSVSSWRWLNTYESWMALETDSTKAENRKQLVRFSARDLTNPSLSAEQLSDMVWFSRSLDSTVSAPWMARLQRDAPGHSTAIYLRGLATLQAMWAARIDTAQALTQLESLWPTVTPDRQLWLAEYGADLSRRDEVAANRWSARLLAASHDETARRDAAERLLKLPALRARGEEALRALLVVTTVERERRLLDESAAAHAARVDRSRRATLAVLGQALAADGALKAARDTLTLATAGGWIPGAFATLGDVRLALGDTSGAVDAWAHTAVDPNTTTARRAALDSAVRRVGQRSRWDGAQQDARRVLAARVMERATNRHVDDVPLLGLDGRSHQLSSLRGDRGTVVVFWSHECGYAVEAVPELQALSARLAKRGVPMLLVADAARMTPALMATLKEKQVTMPVYLDATGRATATFNNWGTPTLYVLDSKGRVAFPSARAMSQVLLYAEAVLGSAP
jgi:predicted negative regulator of RcsB-dependent stress response